MAEQSAIARKYRCLILISSVTRRILERNPLGLERGSIRCRAAGGSGNSALSRVNGEATMKVALRGDRILIAPPDARADADQVGEHPRKVTLVGKAAGQRHLRKPSRRIAQDALCLIDTALQQPAMRRQALRSPKGAAEMTDRKAASVRQVDHRRVARDIVGK